MRYWVSSVNQRKEKLSVSKIRFRKNSEKLEKKNFEPKKTLFMFFLPFILLADFANAECSLTTLSVTCRPSQIQFDIDECSGECG